MGMNKQTLETIWDRTAYPPVEEDAAQASAEAGPASQHLDPRQMLNGIIVPAAQRVPMEPIAERA